MNRAGWRRNLPIGAVLGLELNAGYLFVSAGREVEALQFLDVGGELCALLPDFIPCDHFEVVLVDVDGFVALQSFLDCWIDILQEPVQVLVLVLLFVILRLLHVFGFAGLVDFSVPGGLCGRARDRVAGLQADIDHSVLLVAKGVRCLLLDVLRFFLGLGFVELAALAEVPSFFDELHQNQGPALDLEILDFLLRLFLRLRGEDFVGSNRLIIVLILVALL